MFKVKVNLLLFFFGFLWISAQQNTEFIGVKKEFDHKRAQIIQAFKQEFQKPYTQAQVENMKSDFLEFMSKLDSIENVAAINALVAVRTREDLEFLDKNTIEPEEDKSIKTITTSTTTESSAVYPGGMDKLRKQITELFYYSAIRNNPSKISSQITFIVERDGSISHVKATGEDAIFNRQAQIAMYMLPEKFSPAKVGNSTVRYRFRMPLTMNFD